MKKKVLALSAVLTICCLIMGAMVFSSAIYSRPGTAQAKTRVYCASGVYHSGRGCENCHNSSSHNGSHHGGHHNNVNYKVKKMTLKKAKKLGYEPCGLCW